MLAPFNKQNLNRLYEWYQDPQYEVFFRHFEPYLSFEDFVNQLQLSGNRLLVVGDNQEGVAFIKIFPRTQSAEVSLLLEIAAQGTGYGIKVMIEIGQYLFIDYGLNRMILIVPEKEEHLNYIIQKGGFELEGTYRESCYYDHKLQNENRYSMTKEIFIERYSKTLSKGD